MNFFQWFARSIAGYFSRAAPPGPEPPQLPAAATAPEEQPETITATAKDVQPAPRAASNGWEHLGSTKFLQWLGLGRDEPKAVENVTYFTCLKLLSETMAKMPIKVYTYDDGCQIVLEGEGFESKDDTPYIEGPLGKVYKGFRCTIPDVMEKLAELPDPEPQNTDFLECVRTRRRFALDEEIGHRSCTLVNMGACALRLNRTLHFDPVSQLFVGDDAANRLVDQPMRRPWQI